MARPFSDYAIISLPEFCPNESCAYHDLELARNSTWFDNYGHFFSKARGKTKRFRCKSCGKLCSTQTFSIDYWTHSKANMQDLENRVCSSSGYRQIGRDAYISYNVLANRMQRQARNYLALFAIALKNQPIEENASFDGFESFLNSQFFPVNYHILVGSESRMPYMVNAEVLSRKGRMTDEQKEKNKLIRDVWKQRPGAIRKSCESLFETIAQMVARRDTKEPWILFTDEKKEYPLAMHRVDAFRELQEKGLILHKTTNSKEPRTFTNDLFPSNYIDRELRKNGASHVRETVRQDRELNMAMTRMIILLGHHAFRKPFKIGKQTHFDEDPTHADMVGLQRNERTWPMFERLYTHRHVFSHLSEKPEWIRQIWKREYKNPPLIDFTTGMIKEKGQPGTRWTAKHLVV